MQHNTPCGLLYREVGALQHEANLQGEELLVSPRQPHTPHLPNSVPRRRSYAKQPYRLRQCRFHLASITQHNTLARFHHIEEVARLSLAHYGLPSTEQPRLESLAQLRPL